MLEKLFNKIDNLTKSSLPNSFEGKRLGSISDVNNYIKEVYRVKGIEKNMPESIYNIKGLLQNNYGTQNCSLTCITCVVWYLLKYTTNYSDKIVYRTVKNNTNWYSYDENKYGTIPIFIDNILGKTMDNFHLGYASDNKTFKNVPLIGYKFKHIQERIKAKTPVILNIFRDGRNYYDNHSITVIGYNIFTVINEKGKREDLIFLKVLDNWREEPSYVDFQKISTVSSITYVEQK